MTLVELLSRISIVRRPRCLNSVLTQSYQNYECLVIDDQGSELQLLKRIIETLNDRRFRSFFMWTIKAVAQQGIQALKIKGEFIAFLDSDDEWRSDKLSKQLSFMIDNSTSTHLCSWRQLHAPLSASFWARGSRLFVCGWRMAPDTIPHGSSTRYCLHSFRRKPSTASRL